MSTTSVWTIRVLVAGALAAGVAMCASAVDPAPLVKQPVTWISR